jgi:hypothetical protein
VKLGLLLLLTAAEERKVLIRKVVAGRAATLAMIVRTDTSLQVCVLFYFRKD